jgi:DNA-directed RNA polymerase specialized sigma24 family protein
VGTQDPALDGLKSVFGSGEASERVARALEGLRPRLRAHAARYGAEGEAEDLAAEVIARGWEARARLPAGDEDRARFLWGIARNVLRQWWARPKGGPLRDSHLERRADVESASEETRERAREVAALLAVAPGIGGADLRALLFEGVSIAERARESGRECGAVKVGAHRARRWIVARVTGCEER